MASAFPDEDIWKEAIEDTRKLLKEKPIPRCKDSCWEKHSRSNWHIPWCPYSRTMSPADIPPLTDKRVEPWYVTYSDWRCLNWLRLCGKTGKVVVHNKKCDVPEVFSFNEEKTQ